MIENREEVSREMTTARSRVGRWTIVAVIALALAAAAFIGTFFVTVKSDRELSVFLALNAVAVLGLVLTIVSLFLRFRAKKALRQS